MGRAHPRSRLRPPDTRGKRKLLVLSRARGANSWRSSRPKVASAAASVNRAARQSGGGAHRRLPRSRTRARTCAFDIPAEAKEAAASAERGCSADGVTRTPVEGGIAGGPSCLARTVGGRRSPHPGGKVGGRVGEKARKTALFLASRRRETYPQMEVIDFILIFEISRNSSMWREKLREAC